MANSELQSTYIRLSRGIVAIDEQITALQKERAVKAEALKVLEAHAPKAEPVPKPAAK